MQKKVIVVFIAACLLVMPVMVKTAGAKDLGAATVLSGWIPGTGEWYNNDFRGSFPWGECILGGCCGFVKASSMLDAAAGKTNSDIRLDFWSVPPGK